MKAGKYSIGELLSAREILQIIVPEIQRDYVWGKTQVESLLRSIVEDWQRYKAGIDIELYSCVDLEMKVAFEEFYKKQRFSCNIGFIYAYHDDYYAGKYFLIDGQQRLTTIYLLLLVLSANNQEFRERFEKLYTEQGLPKIDYRVREDSHMFIKELVAAYSGGGLDIRNQSWYYDHYDLDTTIRSIIENINVIESFVTENKLNDADFIAYVENYIEFWYFDTNISAQGEELYIYMNARGEQMQQNENLKAELLLTIDPNGGAKNDWGKKWESWQDFFWQHRGENPNADRGFNEFIVCVAGIINDRNNHPIIYTKEQFESPTNGKPSTIDHHDLLSTLKAVGIAQIEPYIDALRKLFDQSNQNKFCANYNNCQWIEKCLTEIIDLLNRHSTNWFADPKDRDRGKEHSRMVFLWSILNYIIETKDQDESDIENLYRMLRIYYVGYNNYNRSIASIKKNISAILLDGVWSDRSTGVDTDHQIDSPTNSLSEEQLKHQLYRSIRDPQEVREWEELIWRIEDHPLNINGAGLGAINCSHLIDFSTELSTDSLRAIADRFYTLFPPQESGQIDARHFKRLATTLLFYGDFYEQVSPWYCENYRFDNWRRIVRGEPFKSFFTHYLANDDLDEILNQKVVEFEKSPFDMATSSFFEQMKWYAARLKEKIWSQGFYIARSHYNFPGQDKNFQLSGVLVNTKGDFKGGNPKVLSKLK